MAVILRVNHRDEQPMPWAFKPTLDLAELLMTRDYIARHPMFPVLLRARQLDGRGKNHYFNPRGDIQICRVGQPWPSRWIEDVGLADELHTLGFDARDDVPRGPEAFDAFRQRLYRALARCGITQEA